MLAFPTTNDEELVPIIQRLRIIEGLLHINEQATVNATQEELTQIKEQQDVWVEELQTINAQLKAMERDRMMQVSVAGLERGVSIMDIRR